ncbi:MAG: phosphorylase [Leptolyngbya sp.]|nr:MAG: phosphorylase [Leptolyngbya sp.]
MIQTILVPQGAEHRAVCRGLRGIADPPTVLPTPAGAAIAPYLRSLQTAGCLVKGQRVLMMGLCGGLIAKLEIGDAVLYGESLAATPHTCDRDLTIHLQSLLSVPIVQGVTSDRVISTVHDKQQLAIQFSADVVDMESVAVLAILNAIGVSTAVLRVVSDDCHHNIPNLSNAFNAEGSLQPVALAIAMLRHPIAATHLIRGSLHGLKSLQELTQRLFTF